MRDCDILIGGGGFVGMALALALADNRHGQGFNVILSDAMDPTALTGKDWRASAITAASARMLERLGVWGRISDDDREPVAHMLISDGTLEQVARPPILTFDTQGGADDGLDAAIIVKNEALMGALRDCVEENAGIRLMAPARITSFATATNNVRASFDNGGTVTAELLVGADGAKSSIREFAGIKTIDWDYGQWGIVAEIALSRPHKSQAIQHFLPHGPFAMLPLPGDRASLVWSEAEQIARQMLARDKAEICGHILQRLGRRFGEISLTGGPQGFPLGLSIARGYVQPRLALVGDAAHKIHPLAGQGVNMGFKDVAALSDILNSARSMGESYGMIGVLDRYQQWRRFDSVSQALAMDGLNRLFSNDSAPLRAVRDIGMGLVERLPQMKEILVREAAGDTGKVPSLMRP